MEKPSEKPYYCSIVEALKSVKRPGMYAAGEKVCMPLPAISLNGEPNTILGLPLCEAQAKHLIELATRAPYGRGEQTIVDTSVRCTWQLSPTQFTINNPHWEESLKSLLARVKYDMGCDSKVVTCKLYKLLLYESGGHFKKHHDTEKEEGMFGTLMIQLPSNYTGGKLVVYYQGKKSEFDYSGVDCCGNCYFMSFYADCQREVEEVTTGYRLCLVYNLMCQGLDEFSAPTDNQQQVSDIVSAMKKWQEDIESDDCPNMMTYLLEHKYCKANLSFQLLKNGDRVVADVLAQARTEFDFDFYVGQINITEYWDVETDWYAGYSRAISCGKSVCVEHLKACDEEYTLPHIDTDEKSYVPENFLDAMDPDKENFEEATGNEGGSLDKQYGWAALLLWPTRKRMTVMGLENLINLFKQDFDAGKKDLDCTAEGLMKEMHGKYVRVDLCLTFLRALNVFADSKLIAEMLGILVDKKDASSFTRLMEDTTFWSLLVSISCKHGWDILKSPLQTMFDKCTSYYVEEYCAFLKRMITSKEPDDKDLYSKFLSAIVKILAEENVAGHRTVCRKKEFVTELFYLLAVVDSDDLFAFAVDVLCSKPMCYPILKTLGPAIVDFSKSTKVEKDGPMQVILTYCVSHLETSVYQVLGAPRSNARSVASITCSCKDCVELKSFMMHHSETQHRFTIGQRRRQHLCDQLYRADATHVTEKIGSPHTLVVTKTDKSYQQDLKKAKQEQALLDSLKPLLAVTEIPSENEPPIKKQKSES